jgi:hypothetical protein
MPVVEKKSGKKKRGWIKFQPQVVILVEEFFSGRANEVDGYCFLQGPTASSEAWDMLRSGNTEIEVLVFPHEDLVQEFQDLYASWVRLRRLQYNLSLEEIRDLDEQEKALEQQMDALVLCRCNDITILP